MYESNFEHVNKKNWLNMSMCEVTKFFPGVDRIPLFSCVESAGFLFVCQCLANMP